MPAGVSYSPISPRQRAGAAGGAGGISSARRAAARGLTGPRTAGVQAKSDAAAAANAYRRGECTERDIVRILQRESRFPSGATYGWIRRVGSGIRMSLAARRPV